MIVKCRCDSSRLALRRSRRFPGERPQLVPHSLFLGCIMEKPNAQDASSVWTHQGQRISLINPAVLQREPVVSGLVGTMVVIFDATLKRFRLAQEIRNELNCTFVGACLNHLDRNAPHLDKALIE